MPRFLIDANLPLKFSHWHHPDYIHVFNLDYTWHDHKIWEYAIENHLTIVTKDVDFMGKFLGISPFKAKVILLKTGDMKFNEFHEFIAKNWDLILSQSENNGLVIVYPDKIQTMNF